MHFAPIPCSGYGGRSDHGRFWATRSPAREVRHFAQEDGFMSPIKSTDGLIDVCQILVNSGANNKDGDYLERSVEDSSSLSSSSSSSSSSPGQLVSNLSRFLESTTPRFTAQLPSKGCSASSKCDFALSDLWDSFDEWSAYGAGVPIVLYGKETIVQYYVPYLSAIQLYTSEGGGLLRKPARRFSDESDAVCEMDGLDGVSEITSDSEAGNLPSQDCCSANGNRDTAAVDWEQAGNEILIFEYLEAAAPSLRVPLFEKINELARQFPSIRRLCSNDLSQSSWLSVAWYPIYRIPTGSTLKDLGACFLTYHHLSTLQADLIQEAPIRTAACKGQLALYPFGLSSYKFRGAVWTSAGAANCQNPTQLQRSSEKWLKQLGVHHPDFEYFMSHRVPTWHQNC